jgi:hypothetical protein
MGGKALYSQSPYVAISDGVLNTSSHISFNSSVEPVTLKSRLALSTIFCISNHIESLPTTDGLGFSVVSSLISSLVSSETSSFDTLSSS